MSGDDLAGAVKRLEEVFGGPSQNTLGAAVFQSDAVLTVDQMDEFAKSRYQHFAGPAWQSFGEENWTKTWGLVHRRDRGAVPGVLAELKELKDPATALAASQVTENHEDPAAAEKALEGVFDSSSIQDVSIYSIGDSEAITGVLIAGLLDSGHGIALVFLMD
jgi:hypothetical protein